MRRHITMSAVLTQEEIPEEGGKNERKKKLQEIDNVLARQEIKKGKKISQIIYHFISSFFLLYKILNCQSIQI